MHMSDSRVAHTNTKVLDLNPEHMFTFADGIPGFEKVKKFVILRHEQEVPFGRLTAVDFDLCFIVIDPWVVYPEYAPDIDDEELKKIDSPSREELLILAIVNIPEGKPQDSTMNLAAPVILNVKKGMGRQVIINNFKDYSARYALWKQEGEPAAAPERSSGQG
ncbi:MAG: flagellar assembly protein FliW [Candidatus Omnitrophica bacterium]|nr:flagellar assembly protein FliW [Candidatus Omnitrophota bacterium]